MKRRILINILLLSALFGFSTVTHGNPDAFTRNYAAHEDVPTAALSPNGHLKAFVRSTPGVYVDTAMGEEEATEIWTSKPDGGDAKLLLRGHSGTKPENTLAGFSHLQFSPDGRRLYFLSAAWVTSRAIHFLELSSQTNEYVCPGNSLEVIQRGEYAGYLIVSQHRYLLGGGSYDWFWLLTPEGKDVGPISTEEDDSSLKMFREMYMK